MTPEAKRQLCRDIAKAEYPDADIRNSEFGIIIVNDPSFSTRLAPAYITDPTETVRMLFKMFDEYGFSTISDNIRRFYYAESKEERSYPVAIAQAYLAMLKEKAKEKK